MVLAPKKCRVGFLAVNYLLEERDRERASERHFDELAIDGGGRGLTRMDIKWFGSSAVDYQ